MKGVLILFLYGAFFGPIGDLCHLLSNTTAYPATLYRFYLFGIIPFWVPLLFGTASLSIGLTHHMMDTLKPAERPGTQNRVIAYLSPFLFLMIYCLSGFIPFAMIWLGLSALLAWAFLDRTWQGIFLAFATAVIGTGVEFTLVRYSFFSYQPHAAHFLGVPYWLPFLYMIASITIGNLGRHLMTQK